MKRIDLLAPLFQANHVTDKNKYAVLLKKEIADKDRDVEVSVYHSDAEVHTSHMSWDRALKVLAEKGFDTKI